MRDRAARHGRVVAAVGLGLGALYAVVTREPIRFEWAPVALLTLAVSLLCRESRDAHERALVAARDAAALAEARRAVAEQAQRLNGLQSEFVSTVSHELRTPLTAIIGNLVTLQRGVVTDPEIAQTL